MVNTKGSVRTAQLITTYGVGSVVAVEDESWLVAGIDQWPVDEPDIREPRLERELGVRGFVRPPASGDDNEADIPVLRFPEMHYCPECKRLDEHGWFCAANEKRCQSCPTNPPLVPSRFVVACARGHIDDFPYFRWVHAGRQSCPNRHPRLSFRTTGATASLRDIVISCECGAQMTMEGAFGKNALAELGKCKGKKPWLGAEDDCDQVPSVIQRGASNSWYPVLASAISIPPWSDAIHRFLGKNWSAWRGLPDQGLESILEGHATIISSEYSADEAASAIRQRWRREAGVETTEVRLRDQEYEALIHGRQDESHHQEFVCVPSPQSAESGIPTWFDHVMLVKRLREVRVLRAFTRLYPPGQSPLPEEEQQASLSASDTSWLPGIEVNGEGVFLGLDPDRLAAWEGRESVRQRVSSLNENYDRRARRHGNEPDREITPRLVGIHTLAHVLIDQWALDCGYPTAALRERLYVSDDMAGLLIYTATSDSAGSLGGVVAMGGSDILGAALRSAMGRTKWCSADPLCLEAGNQGVDALNLAACHSCVLLPETCCEEMNLFLDRALLVGTPDEPDIGLFADLIS